MEKDSNSVEQSSSTPSPIKLHVLIYNLSAINGQKIVKRQTKSKKVKETISHIILYCTVYSQIIS